MMTIVSLMKEDHKYIAHFLRYHIDLGIDDILVFYDADDADDAQDLRTYLRDELDGGGYSVYALSEVPELQQYLTPPKLFEPIQNAVHQRAQKMAKYPWVITLDADEFLFADSLNSIALAKIPDNISSLRIPVAEAVWLPSDNICKPFGSSGFRTPFMFRWPTKLPSDVRKFLPRIVYREDRCFFPDNVSGHGQGRHIFRSEAAFDFIGPHHAEVDGQSVSKLGTDSLLLPDRTLILHYDAMVIPPFLMGSACRTTRPFSVS